MSMVRMSTVRHLYIMHVYHNILKYENIHFLSLGANVNAQDKYGQAGLLHACSRGHWGVALELVERGADIEKGGEGGTPLVLAARNGHLALVQSLIRRGAYYIVN